MKLRQKLAMVLAAAMVVTTVPVVTMADSTNKLSHPISSVDGTVTTHKNELKLIMDFGTTIEKSSTRFYLDSKDFKFSEAEYAKLNLNEAQAETALENGLKALTAAQVAGLDVEVDGNPIKSIKSVDSIVYDGKTIKAVKATALYDVETKATETKEATVEIKADKIKKATDDLETVIEQINKDLSKEFTYFTAKGEVVYTDKNGNVLVNGDKPAAQPEFTTTKATTHYSPLDEVLLQVQYLSEDQLRVEIISATGADLDNYEVKVGIPIMGTVKKGTPTVSVDAYDSYASAGVYYLTRETVEDGNELSVKVDAAAPVTVDGGELSSFTIIEKEQDAIANASEKDRTVTFTLPASSDLVFAKESTQEKYIKLTGKRAFAPNKDQKIEDLTGAKLEVSKDGKKLSLILPTERKVTTTTGEWIVSGLQVEPEDVKYEASTGDIKVTIDGEMVKEESVVMGVVTEFDQTFAAKEVVELISGKGSKEVTVTLKENVKESLDDKRWATFELSEGAYIKVDKDDVDANGKPVATKVFEKVKVNGDEVTMPEDMLQLVVNQDGNVTGFKVDFEYTNKEDKSDLAKGYLNANKANTIDFIFKVQADSETTGAVTLSAESRAFEVEPVQVANVTSPIEVVFEPTTVKVGLETQALGAITLKETAAGMFTKGEIVIDTDETGLEFINDKKDIKVTTTGTLKAEVSRVTKDGAIVLNVTRQSKEAGEIKIEGVIADIDRTVPEGKIAIEVYGDSLRAFDGVWGDSKYNEKDGHKPGKEFVYEENKAEEFDAPHRFITDGLIEIGTKNTEDITDASRVSEVKVTANATSYVLNGNTLDVPNGLTAYVNADNRMMAPLRLVGDAFGATYSFNHVEGKGVITFFKDGKVVQFVNGSAMMNVNGTVVPMTTSVEIKNNYTFVPLRDLADALGINVSYDAPTSTATFTNK